MSTPAWRFPDPARTIALLLADEFTAVGGTGTYTPADFTGLLPFVRVTRTGGGSTRVDDRGMIDIDVFAVNATDAQHLAEDIRQWLTGAPRRYGAAILDRITCDIGPAEVAPWAPQIKRVNAAYTVVARRHQVS